MVLQVDGVEDFFEWPKSLINSNDNNFFVGLTSRFRSSLPLLFSSWLVYVSLNGREAVQPKDLWPVSISPRPLEREPRLDCCLHY